MREREGKGRKRSAHRIKMRRRSELSLLRFRGICIMATYARHVAIFHRARARARTWERSSGIISPGNAAFVAIAALVTA